MNQIERSPVVRFCQRMSDCPSPLKSAAPAIDHAVDTVGRITALLRAVPLITQMDRSPVVVFCQSMPVEAAAAAATDARGAAPLKETAACDCAPTRPGALAPLTGPGCGE